MNILQEIVKATHTRNHETWRGFNLDTSLNEVRSQSNPREVIVPSIIDKDSTDHMFLLAEIKQGSPSQGIICNPFDPIQLARKYVESGVDGISVLTEPAYFKGSIEDLQSVREVAPHIPILRKDFIVHPYQVRESYDCGADLVLLIVAALQDDMLHLLYDYIVEHGMTPLVEVHSEEELMRALALKPTLIGINNRDLTTFKVDLSTTIQLMDVIPSYVKVVSESGIHTEFDVSMLASIGVAGVLIGQSILTSDDIGMKIRNLKAEQRSQ